MRAVALLILAVLIQFGETGCSDGADIGGTPTSASMARLEAELDLCSSDNAFNVNTARRLRDMLAHPLNEPEKLSARAALDSAASRCVTSESSLPAMEILGTLYVLLGNRHLAVKDNANAEQVFAAADQFYSRSGAPSLAWLEAVRGAARAALRGGNSRPASELAHRQTTLARDWVEKRGFVQDALVDALKFEAEVMGTTEQRDRAETLLDEAARVESLSRAKGQSTPPDTPGVLDR